MRHNPSHAGFPEQGSPRLYAPLQPTRLRDMRAPTPERRASPRTYPPSQEPTPEEALPGVARLYKQQHRFRVGLEEKGFVLEVFRAQNEVTFVATPLVEGQAVVRRTVPEAELASLLQQNDRWAVWVATAATDLAPKVRILKKKYAKALKIGFYGTRECASERLTSTTRRCGDKLYVIDLIREPQTGGSRKDAEAKGDLCALKFRAYEPNASSYPRPR